MKKVKSTDPRKVKIVEILKNASNGVKVTNVLELKTGGGMKKFSGHCFSKEKDGRKYNRIGCFEVYFNSIMEFIHVKKMEEIGS